MEKRLSRSDYVFTLLFIFMLIAVVAAFFYGIKTGKDKTEAKYELLASKENLESDVTAYDQQHLVSFYHTIYFPYRDFQKKWFEQLNQIELNNESTDVSSLFKELATLADQKYTTLLRLSTPEVSPLLKEAHDHYLKSLKLFADAAKKFQTWDSSVKGMDLIEELEQDAYIQEAKRFALTAQHNYFSSIVKWNQNTDPISQANEISSDSKVNIAQWNQLSLILKTDYIAAIMLKHEYFKPYYPQDVTVGIDELIQTGQTNKLKLNDIEQVVDILVQTGAVRLGDYISSKDKYYAGEIMPLLPFFYE